MLCFQVSAQFAFVGHHPVLVSTHIKEQHAPARLVRSGLPFGHRLKNCRWFSTQEEAAQFVAHLHHVYRGRYFPGLASPAGQLLLFEEDF